jgi:hypothetical protein
MWASSAYYLVARRLESHEVTKKGLIKEDR